MAETRLADVIVPEVFNAYVVQKSVQLNAFYQSGIMADLSALPAINGQMMSADPGVDGGGTTVNMPFWNDLDGDDEVIDDTANLTVNKITTGKDVAVKLLRAKAFGASDLSGELAGSDPMLVIGDRIADYWNRRYQAAVFATLAGAMGTTKSGQSMAANVSDISGLSGAAAVFDGEAFVDANGLLGDHQGMLSATAVHSDTFNLMKKQDLIDFVKDSDASDAIPYYMNKRLIVDDSCPVTSGTYTTYLFGAGAVGWAAGSPKVPSEVERNALVGGGQEYLVTRAKFICHIRGIKWDPSSGVPAGPTPTNDELAIGANWARVYDPKLVRVVAFKHKLA